MTPRRPPGRKLLIASIGVAAVSYVACTTAATSGNLVAPPDGDAATKDGGQNDDAPVTSGNLIAPPDTGTDAHDSGSDAPADAPDAG